MIQPGCYSAGYVCKQSWIWFGRRGDDIAADQIVHTGFGGIFYLSMEGELVE
ncbi:MAG: hypothetical protein AB9917_01145 [Negativicutes bacterium]